MLTKTQILGELEHIDQYAPLAVVPLSEEQTALVQLLREALHACAQAGVGAGDATRRRLKLQFEECKRAVPAGSRGDPGAGLCSLFELAEAHLAP